MTVLVAPVAGPLLGGWITDNIRGRGIFYINIPRHLIAGGDVVDLPQRDPGPRLPFDYVGPILLS
jgi:DHA2 family multidrug resistance protein